MIFDLVKLNIQLFVLGKSESFNLEISESG